jgi:hypothetical protein
MNGTPTKRQVSKRSVSKRQVYKTSGFKTFGFKTSIEINSERPVFKFAQKTDFLGLRQIFNW